MFTIGEMEFCEAEIDDVDLVFLKTLADDEVGGFHVSVDEAPLVYLLDAVYHLQLHCLY